MFVNSKSSSTRKRSWEWGQWGPGEAILTPQQKVNKFILNDWSSESRDKESPAETGCSRVMGCIHSSVVAGMLEKPKVGLGGRNSTCSVPWLILPHCDNYCPETENCSFLGPLLANFMEEGKHGRGRRERAIGSAGSHPRHYQRLGSLLLHLLGFISADRCIVSQGDISSVIIIGWRAQLSSLSSTNWL